MWVAVWTHRQQGSRIECKWSNAYPAYGSQLGERHIHVQAINQGRSPTTISGWGLEIVDPQDRLTDSTVVVFKSERWQPTLPYRLDSESSVGWMIAFDEPQATLARHPAPVKGVLAYVQTGTGRRVYSATPVDPKSA